jgi:Fur family transcriptional regulator, ferric uptake regulator
MSPETQRFNDLLKQHGSFATKQRRALFKYLQAHPEISVSELVSALPDQDQATVYRNIKLFEQIGVITRLRLGWNSRLELSSAFHDHHHHMTCTNCGKVIAWEEDPNIELRIQTLAMKLGFLPQDHQLEVRGLCQNCQNL